MALESSGDPYPNLTAREFLAFYGVKLTLKGNVVSFDKKEKGLALAQLETRYLNAKAWMNKFFFLNGAGWEFPEVEGVMGDFPVRSIWAPIHDDKSLWASMASYSRRELAHIETVCFYAASRLNNLWSNFILTSVHIDRFLMSPHRYHVLGHDFILTGSISISLSKSIEQSR